MTKKGGSNCAAPFAGGRRRKTRRTRNRSRKMKGGNFYGVGDAITPGAIEYRAVENNGPDASGRIPAGDIAPGTMTGASRRRRARGRKMRGGANQISAIKSNAGFTGNGIGGMAEYTDVGSNKGGNPY